MKATRNQGEGTVHTPCRSNVTSLASWWREVQELEVLLGYDGSSPASRKAWDAILACEVPAPRAALYLLLRDCVHLWQTIAAEREADPCPLLDSFVGVAVAERLILPTYAVLVAFQLRRQLFGLRSVLAAQRLGEKPQPVQARGAIRPGQ